MARSPGAGRRRAAAARYVAVPSLGAAAGGLPAGDPPPGALPAEVPVEAVVAAAGVVPAVEEGALPVAEAAPAVRRRAGSLALRRRVTAARRETPTRAAVQEDRPGDRRSAAVSTSAGPTRSSPAVKVAAARRSPEAVAAEARSSPAVEEGVVAARSSPAVKVEVVAARRSPAVVEVEPGGTPCPEQRAWDGWSDSPGCDPPRRDPTDPARAGIAAGVAPSSDFYRNRRQDLRCGYSP